MRRATPADMSLLVDLMEVFYAESGFDLNRAHATQAFGAVLEDERLGYVWLVEAADGQEVGHLVVTRCYSMEYGGLKGVLDDFFVKAPFRNTGLGTAALAEMRAFCEEQGIRAVTVEVGLVNDPAQAVYRRVGFAETEGRQLLVLELAAPTHSLVSGF